MKEEKEQISKSKQILKISAWCAAAVFFVVLLGFSVAENNVKECRDVSIKIDHENGCFFIDENDAQSAISSFIGGSIHGKVLATIDFGDMEKMFEENKFILNSEVFSRSDGTLHVELQQRVPIVRVVNKNGVSFYLDENGEKIPLSPKFTARVVVATGEFEPAVDTGVVANLMKLVKFISQDKFWKAQFEQINITAHNEFELIPKLGNHYIMFGKADAIEKKFEKLMIFYKEVLKNFSADEYRFVNLKYEDQIVCTKS